MTESDRRRLSRSRRGALDAETLERIADLVRVVRRRKGWTVEEFAMRAGMPKSQLSTFVGERRGASEGVLERVLAVIECALEAEPLLSLGDVHMTHDWLESAVAASEYMSPRDIAEELVNNLFAQMRASLADRVESALKSRMETRDEPTQAFH